MNKTELVAAIAEQTELSKKDAEKALTDAQDDRIPQSAKDAVKKAVDEAKAVISE